MYKELFVITLIDLEAKAKYIVSENPPERVLVGHDIYIYMGMLKHKKLCNILMCDL